MKGNTSHNKSLLDLEYNEIIYFKNYVKTLNEKFSDRSVLDMYFEKLSLKSFDEMLRSLKFMSEKSDIVTEESEKLEIFDTSTAIKLSPEFETTEKSSYIKFLSELVFFRFGKKLVFKNFNVETFCKKFNLKVSNPEILEKHFSKLMELNNFFSGLRLDTANVEIDSEELWNKLGDNMTWLGIPISKNNSKEFNQMMLTIWLYVETPKIYVM